MAPRKNRRKYPNYLKQKNAIIRKLRISERTRLKLVKKGQYVPAIHDKLLIIEESEIIDDEE